MNTAPKWRAVTPVFGAYQENETRLKRFLRRVISNRHDIEDICQETILRALEAEKSRNIHEPRAFLFGVSKNIVRKKLNRDSNSLIRFIEDFSPREYVSSEPPLEDAIDDQQRMLFFAEALVTLPSQCQRVFIMKKVYGYSHKEIAAQLGISISTVEKHVATGLRRCTDYMHKKLGAESCSAPLRKRNAGS